MNKDLEQILTKRLAIAHNEDLPISTRKAEDQITRTILAIARLLIDDDKEEQIDNKTETNKKAEKTAQNKAVNCSLLKKASQNTTDKNNEANYSENICFNDAHKIWLTDNFKNYTNLTALTNAFNKHFKTNKHRSTINVACVRLGLKNHISHTYTREEINWLKTNVHTMNYTELAELFQRKFGRQATAGLLRSYCYRAGLSHQRTDSVSIFSNNDNNCCPFQQNDTADKPDIQHDIPVKTQSTPWMSWNDDHKQWLLDNFDKYSTMVALTEAFNEHFGITAYRQLITEKCKLYGLTEHTSTKYTAQEDEWLRLHVSRAMPFETLNDLFKIYFNKDVSTSALKAHCRNLGVLDRYYCKIPSTNISINDNIGNTVHNNTHDDKLVSATEKIIAAAEKISDAADRITAQHSNNCNVFIQ